MDIDAILDSEWFILCIRVLCLVAACMMTYWSYRSLEKRRSMKLAEFPDYMLVFIGCYWACYMVWTILQYSFYKFGVPSTGVLVFNQRFGLLMTLTVFTALIKDRLLLDTMFEMLVSKSPAETEAGNEGGGCD